MIDKNLYPTLTPLQRDTHRDLRWASTTPDYAKTAGLNALFLTAVEMPDACLEYPVVFTNAGQGADGKNDVAPIAVLGLSPGENLMLDSQALATGGAAAPWLATYVPALLRTYPIAIARETDSDYVLCVDTTSQRWSTTEGERLFNDDGTTTPFLDDMRVFLEKLEVEVERTRQVGRRLLELDLLQAMRFDATSPSGQTVTVDGFLAVDETKLLALPDNVLLELTRSGLMKLLQAQLLSMANLSRLVERRWQRADRTAAKTAA
jgi:hypothetical protein